MKAMQYIGWAKKFSNKLTSATATAVLVGASIGAPFIASGNVSAGANRPSVCQDYTVAPVANHPDAPTLVTPANHGTANNGFDFTWSNVIGATAYDWESSLSADTKYDGSFVQQLSTHRINGTSINEGNSPSNTYYWHVRAVDSTSSTGNWSQVWTVTIDNSRSNFLSAPTLTAPANGAVRNITQQDFDFTWDAPVINNGTALTYQFQSGLTADTDPLTGGFTNSPYNDFGLTKTSIPDGNSATAVYYWHVRATTADGEVGPWSTTWKVDIRHDVCGTTGGGSHHNNGNHGHGNHHQPTHGTHHDNGGDDCDDTSGGGTPPVTPSVTPPVTPGMGGGTAPAAPSTNPVPPITATSSTNTTTPSPTPQVKAATTVLAMLTKGGSVAVDEPVITPAAKVLNNQTTATEAPFYTVKNVNSSSNKWILHSLLWLIALALTISGSVYVNRKHQAQD